MRFLFSAVIIGCMFSTAGAQVCNTASTLRPGRFSIGLAPVINVDHGHDVDFFINMGMGLTHSVDLSIKMILDEPNYFGGDCEIVLLSGFPTISIAPGLHFADDLGLDAAFNISLPIRRIIAIYGGLDADVNFHDGGTSFPLWGFIGFQAMMRKSLALFMETDIGANDGAPDLFDFGINVFF